MGIRPYARRPGSKRSEATRERIKGAVRDLLAEGAFHASTMEEVADRAGVARATLYQHFRSRVELVDAMCELFDANPALVELRRDVDLPDGRRALERVVAGCVDFWSAEDAVLRELYGVAAVDPAASALVERQRSDRRGELERLVRNLERDGLLRDGAAPEHALAILMLLTSYDGYRELRAAGLGDGQVAALLQETARARLLRSA